MTNFKTYQLALNFYRDCKKLSITDRVLRDQFRRASLSIVLNIAEGYGRASMKDRKKFYVIAFGSLRETQCLLEILENQEMKQRADHLAGYLYRLCQSPGCLLPEK